MNSNLNFEDSAKHQKGTPAESLNPEDKTNKGKGMPSKPIEDDLDSKGRFVQLLKQYIYKEKGDQIYDQIIMDIGSLFYEQLKAGTLTTNVEVNFILDLDLMHMIHYSQFVGENFARCIFRYTPHLSTYVRDTFLLKLEEEEKKVRASVLRDFNWRLPQSAWEHFSVKTNLKLSNFPLSVDRVNPSVLLRERLLREYGQLVQIKLARVVSVFEPSSYLYKQVKK